MFLPKGPTPKIALVGEAPGETEEMLGIPFTGSSGQEEKRICRDAGIDFDSVLRTNVSVMRPSPKDNSFERNCVVMRKDMGGNVTGLPEVYRHKFLHPALMAQVKRLQFELLTHRPNIVIALGAVPMAILTGNVGIGKSRGTVTESTLVPGLKVIGTYHPSNILRTWKNRVISVADHIKALRESAFPEIRRPKREIWIEPTLDDIRFFKREYLDNAKVIAFDIECARGELTCIGFAGDSTRALVIPFVSKRSPGYSYWSDPATEVQAWKLVQSILALPNKKVGQNGLFDIQWLWKYKIKVHNYAEDTMILHHALHPEMQKSLGFLGSIYTDEASWKLIAPRHYGKMNKLED